MADNVSPGSNAYTQARIVGGRPMANGESSISGGGRLKTKFAFPRIYRKSEYFSRPEESSVYGMNTIAHEVFLHGEAIENNFIKGYTSSFIRNSSALGASDHQDGVFNKSSYAKQGISIMRQGLTILSKTTSGDVKGISNERLNLMLQWGRGIPGWAPLLGKKDGEQISKEDLKKLNEKTE